MKKLEIYKHFPALSVNHENRGWRATRSTTSVGIITGIDVICLSWWRIQEHHWGPNGGPC